MPNPLCNNRPANTMKRLVIAIDCDDVIVSTTPLMIDTYNRTYGTSINLRDAYNPDLALWEVPDADMAIARVNSFLESLSMRLKPLPGAFDGLGKLASIHELHLVTGRADYLETLTREWVQKNLPGVFSSIECTNYIVPSTQAHRSRSKLEVCRSIHADILVDDHPHHVEQVLAGGTDAIVFGKYPWNDQKITHDTTRARLRRVSDWDQLVALLAGGHDL